jgi:TolC family type I secretion outer membrane protein
MSDRQTVRSVQPWRSVTAGCSTALAIILTSLHGLPATAEQLRSYAPTTTPAAPANPCAQTLFAGAELDCNALKMFGAAGIVAPVVRTEAAPQGTGRSTRTATVRLPDNPPVPPRRSVAMSVAESGGARSGAGSGSGMTHVTVPDVALTESQDRHPELPRQRASALLPSIDPATGRSAGHSAGPRRTPQQEPAPRVAMAREAAPNLIMRTDVPMIGPVLPARQDARPAIGQGSEAQIAPAQQSDHPTIKAESVTLPLNPPVPPRQTLSPSQIAATSSMPGRAILPDSSLVATPSITGSTGGSAGNNTGGSTGGQAVANLDVALRTAQATTTPDRAPGGTEGTLAGGPDDSAATSSDVATDSSQTDYDLPAPSEPRSRVPTSGMAFSLDEAIEMAVRRSPKVGLASARSWDAYYGVNVARSVRRPQVEGTIGIGQQTLGTDRQHESWRMLRGGDEVGYARFDAQLSLRQLIYDFGESKRTIASANHNYFSERFRMVSRIDEVASDTITAYLSLMEQRTLITAAEENLEAHVEFEELVRLNEANGNGTQADVERIVARRLDAQTLLTDLEAALEDAADQLERLTRTAPGVLTEPRSIDKLVPRNPDLAMAHMAQTNPELLSIQAGRQAAEYALESHRAKNMPRVEFEVTGKNDNYYNARSRSELDIKSMFTVRHRFSDGGKRRNEMRQLEMRVEQQIYRYEDRRIDLEADIRRLFRAIQAADDKVADLEEGLKSSRKVRELYTEQFREGGRTLFELLDAQTALFTAIRERTNNRYTRLRAQYQLLKAIGLLGESVYAQMGPVDVPLPGPAPNQPSCEIVPRSIAMSSGDDSRWSP